VKAAGCAAALTLVLLRQLLATCDRSNRGRRDRALLLFGFAAALRRAELVAIHVEDVAEIAGGLRLRITHSKTDQTGQGAEIGLPRGRHAETCPVQAFHDWQAVLSMVRWGVRRPVRPPPAAPSCCGARSGSVRPRSGSPHLLRHRSSIP
jgi:integrase